MKYISPATRYLFVCLANFTVSKIHSNKSILTICLVTLLSLTSLSYVSLAATFTVTKTADTNDGVCDSDCSLREAIAAANLASTDDIIDFSPAVFSVAQTISLSGTELSVAEGAKLTINGPGINLLTISGNGQSRVIVVNATAIVSINNLKIANGKVINNDVGAGLVSQVATTALSHVAFEGNSSLNRGGAIYNAQGDLTIEDCVFTNNSALNEGGAIFSTTFTSIIPTVNITNSSFVGNSATNSNGGAIAGSYTLTVSDSSFSNNKAASGGAAVGGTFINVQFVDNTAQTLAGGAILDPKSVTNCTFTGNFATVRGGAIDFEQPPGSRTIQNSIFAMNSANQDGGAIYNFRTNLIITGTLLANNHAVRDGGSFYHDNAFSSTSIDDSTIKDGLSGRNGGGIFNSSGVLNISNSTLSNNNGVGNGGEGGGGIYNQIATLNLSNSTLNGNTSVQGGGIFNRGTVALTDNTIAANKAFLGGGGVFNFNTGSVTAHNTIIGDNTSTTAGTSPDFRGTINSQGFNLVEKTTGLIVTGITNGNILGKDPQLVGLRNSGGVTDTIALQPTSPAIDMGDPNNFPSTDQRGIARSQDGDLNGTLLPDIGAYERQVTPFVVTKTTDTSDGLCDGDCSLREAIGSINATVSPDVVVAFDPAMFSSSQTISETAQLTVPGIGTLVIHGPGSNLLTLNGNNLNRVALIDTGGVAVISGLKIANGNDNNPSSDNGGGGIRVQGILSLKDCAVLDNRASNFGGGIYLRNGSAAIDNCTISNNTSGSGGGGLFINVGSASLTNSVFDQNSTNLDGGAIANAIGSLNAFNISVTRNTAVRASGGIDNDGTAVINNSSINSNSQTANFGGAGGVGNSGNMTLTNTTVSGNTALFGAGISNGSTLDISGSLIAGNSSTKTGGGIYNTGGPLTVTNTTLSSNIVLSTGGTTDGFGGGLFQDANSPATLVNVTIVNNSAGFSGGGVHIFGSSVLNAHNTIIANNSANNSGSDVRGSLVSQGFNLIKSTGGMTLSGTTTGNVLGQDPHLSTIDGHGGPTATLALLPGSPAIDAADPNSFPSTDQRGVARPKDGDKNGIALPDIGAFELDLTRIPRADFDGDGKTDPTVFRGSDHNWYALESGGGVLAQAWGNANDVLTPGDYDGDGRADTAIYRVAEGLWYIVNSATSTVSIVHWGNPTDKPVLGDFDGDGKSDIAVYRPSEGNWYIINSQSGSISSYHWGIATDKPVPGDYDGDGKTDVAVYRESDNTWYIINSQSGSVSSYYWGTAGDKPVEADYDGDGRDDVAVYRPSEGNWYIINSQSGSVSSYHWGIATDIPVPGDYDGDGKTDVAVYRESDNNWYIINSQSGSVSSYYWGTAGDIPIPAQFLP